MALACTPHHQEKLSDPITDPAQTFNKTDKSQIFKPYFKMLNTSGNSGEMATHSRTTYKQCS